MRRLLIRPGAIGDCLCALPALYMLRGSYTEIWTNATVAPLVAFGDRVCSLSGTGFARLGLPDDGPAAAAALQALVERLRGFDEVLSWSGANQPLLQERARHLGLPLHFFEALPAPDAATHVTDFFLHQTKAWHGLDEEPEPWRSSCGRRFLLRGADNPPSGLRPAASDARPLVVLHPFSGSAAKNWSLASFRNLAGMLQPYCRIRWCASPEDALPSDLLSSAWIKEDLPSLVADLATADLYVGNDSGITHLAAMLGIPVVVMFGPMDPAVWAPRGSVTHILRTDRPAEATEKIPLEIVWQTIRKALHLPDGPRI